MTRDNDPLDRKLGARIRHLRIARNMSQTDLGKEIGVTFQQVQKYENGSNAFPSTRIPAMLRALRASGNDVFADGRAVDPVPDLSRWAIRVAMALDALPDPKRRLIVLFLRALDIGEIDAAC